jgi:hypothetical protein
MAYLPTAGPGVRALLAADPTFDVARFLEGAKSAYQIVLEAYWKGDAAGFGPSSTTMSSKRLTRPSSSERKDGLLLDNRLVNIEAGADYRGPGRPGCRRGNRCGSRRILLRSPAIRTAKWLPIAERCRPDPRSLDLSAARSVRATPNWLLIETDEEE